jgi:glycosyltransferase involved in cell wall biosynthesis
VARLDPLVVVANTRMPSQRAQALQVAHMAAAFARAGAPTSLYVAQRRASVALPAGVDAFDWYGVPPGPRPALTAISCVDWIERVPRLLQYVPARLQEETFARNAARQVLRDSRGARILSREIECALRLVRAKEKNVFLEVHRVPRGRLRRRWLSSTAAGVRGIVAISNGVREDLEELGVDPAHITVEHDAFEPARFAAMPDKVSARKTLELPLGAPIVVYTGGLLSWKGVDLLVEAARSLPDVYVAIAGGMDADVKKLRQLAGGLPNVRIDGFQAPDRVALYLAAADVGVVPNRSKPDISARYTSPLKVFESMAAGLPLVASDVPSLRELLHDGVDAVMVKPDDAHALREGIVRLVGDAKLRASMSERMRARASAHTWDARAQRILAWMDERG